MPSTLNSSLAHVGWRYSKSVKKSLPYTIGQAFFHKAYSSRAYSNFRISLGTRDHLATSYLTRFMSQITRIASCNGHICLLQH